jgi:translation initiation factor IF-3
MNPLTPRVALLKDACRNIRRTRQDTMHSCSIAWSPPVRLKPWPVENQLVGTSAMHFSSEASKQKMKAASDHQIKSEWIQLVNPSSTLKQASPTSDSDSNQSANLLVEPALTREVLSRLDLNQYTLIEVNSKTNPPICKIVSREALIQKERTKIKQKKEQQKSNRLENVLKEIQLTWKIEMNDLNHKLKAAQQSFEKGYKVRVILNAPSRYQQMDQNHKDELLAIVEKQLIGFGGELVKQETEGGKLIMEWHPVNKQR